MCILCGESRKNKSQGSGKLTLFKSSTEKTKYPPIKRPWWMVLYQDDVTS